MNGLRFRESWMFLLLIANIIGKGCQTVVVVLKFKLFGTLSKKENFEITDLEKALYNAKFM